MILFLDFDGVLHRACFAKETEFCHVARLEHVLKPFPTVEIVISSTWRKFESLSELRKHFSPEFSKRIVDVTPALDYLEHDYLRYDEIQTWLVANARDKEDWIAIDDEASDFPTPCVNLLLTDSRTAFDALAEKKLIQMLSEGVHTTSRLKST